MDKELAIKMLKSQKDLSQSEIDEIINLVPENDQSALKLMFKNDDGASVTGDELDVEMIIEKVGKKFSKATGEQINAVAATVKQLQAILSELVNGLAEKDPDNDNDNDSVDSENDPDKLEDKINKKKESLKKAEKKLADIKAAHDPNADSEPNADKNATVGGEAEEEEMECKACKKKAKVKKGEKKTCTKCGGLLQKTPASNQKPDNEETVDEDLFKKMLDEKMKAEGLLNENK